MRSHRPLLLSLAVLLGSTAGCVVHEREVVRAPAPACPGGVWVEGHDGPHGAWRPAHWRCPGVVEERIVIHP